MEVLYAKSSGFCYGVKRALRLAEGSLKKSKPVYTLGPLIHNRHVIDDLEKKGIRVVDDVSEIDSGVVIIRSHGVEPEVLETLRGKDVEIVDATCPFVKKVHKIAQKLTRKGYTVIVVGERKHPEVRSILGYAPEALVVERVADLDASISTKKVGVISQTTMMWEKYSELIQRLLYFTFEELRIFNTICSATTVRQEDTLRVAKQVDVMFVVGGKNSANTNRLAELSRTAGVKTFHIEDASNLKPPMYEGVKKAGIAAGASTPSWIIDGVMDFLKKV